MILINVLGVAKGKGKRGSPTAVAAPMGEGGSILVKALAAMIAIAIINGGYWFVLDKQKRDTATQMAVAERKNRELWNASTKPRTTSVASMSSINCALRKTVRTIRSTS